jgi:hypothetical protein
MNTNKGILPKELHDILHSPEFDDDAGILIESIDFKEPDVYLTFSIRFDIDTPKQNWQIIVSESKEEQIINEWTQDIDVYEAHVLLLEHNDIYTELYFTGTTTNSDALFIDIFKGLIELSDNANEISKYIIPPEYLDKLSTQGHGLFARGPKTILEIYEQCLIKHGIKPTFIGNTEFPIEYKLLKLGSSFFVGQNFQFSKV